MGKEGKRQRQLRKKLRKQQQRRHQARLKSYEHRALVLKQLGFKSYPAYLASALWAEIRLRVLEAEARLCRICRRPATQVHHQQYDYLTLAGYDLYHLIPLCAGCHVSSEFDRQGEKRKMPAVVARIDQRIEAAMKGRRKGRKVLKALREDAEGMRAAGQAVLDLLASTPPARAP